MTTIGDVAVKLGLDSKEFIKQIDKAEDECKKLEHNLNETKESFEKMSKAMAMTEKPTEEMKNAYKELKDELTKNQSAFDNFNKNLDRVSNGLEKTLSPVESAIAEFDELETKLKKSKEDFVQYAKAMAMTEKPTEEMKTELKRLKKELDKNQKAFDKSRDKAKQMGASFQKVNPIIEQLKNKLLGLTKIGFVVTLTKKLIDLGKEAVNTAAKFENLSVSFEVLAGGAEAGKKLTNQIVELASKTPLTTEALSDGAKTLLSFGESASNIIDDLKLLGDITGGDAQRMQSLTLAFAQIGSTGKLAGQDLLQMINAGFNPLEQISKKTGKSIGQLKDEMSKGLITYKDVKQAMIDATSEGGRFYGMMNKQSETLDGRLSTLSDTWQLVSKNIGDFFLPMAKAAVTALNAIGQAVLDLQSKMRTKKAKNDVRALNKALEYQQEQLSKARTETEKKEWETRIAQTKEYLKIHQAILDTGNTPQGKKEIDGFDALSTTGTGTGTKQQDKALEAYKKYIEEYAKLNDDYAATLKARQYVEGTLNIDPITQQEEYNKMLALYQAHLSKMAEIRRSGTRNQAEIEKLEEEKLAQDLQTFRLDKERETQRKLQEIIKGYNDTETNLDIANVGTANSFLGGLSSEYKAKLDLEIWYQQERKKIIQESNNDLQLQAEAFAQLDNLKAAKLVQANLSTWEDYGRSVSSIMSNVYTNLITGQESFADAMKNMAQNMLLQLLQMLAQYVMKELAIRAASMFLGGFGGGIGNIFGGLFSGGTATGVTPSISSHHSGGMIPGTKEQIAVLQGGERILNRSEAANYNSDETSGDGGINNIMVFNIKAWDGRDVIDTLKANEQTINQIVSSGIKNNKQGLRTVVQNT